MSDEDTKTAEPWPTFRKTSIKPNSAAAIEGYDFAAANPMARVDHCPYSGLRDRATKQMQVDWCYGFSLQRCGHPRPPTEKEIKAAKSLSRVRRAQPVQTDIEPERQRKTDAERKRLKRRMPYDRKRRPGDHLTRDQKRDLR